MSKNEELLSAAQQYSEKLSAVKKHPPIAQRYSNDARDRISTSMRSYYKQVSTILSSDNESKR